MNNQLFFKNREEWHNWLSENGKMEKVVWLIFYKKGSGKSGISYDDALDEALCYGWIDSLVKRIDNEKYAQKFTPRTNKAKWSNLNKMHVKRLITEGRMTPAGLALLPESLEITEPPPKKEVLEIPGFISASLQENQAANAYFQKLAPSHKREFILWIMNAKKEETRRKRLKEMLEKLQNKEKLGLK